MTFAGLWEVWHDKAHHHLADVLHWSVPDEVAQMLRLEGEGVPKRQIDAFVRHVLEQVEAQEGGERRAHQEEPSKCIASSSSPLMSSGPEHSISTAAIPSSMVTGVIASRTVTGWLAG